jgi:hypothetical protein
MNGLTINNTDDSISGGRFTDLFNAQNYVNRKWILMMGAVSVDVADHVQIGQGIITDQIDQSSASVTLSLLEDVSALAVEVPTNRVNTGDHPNAPENNFGKPVPMSFGDFGLETDIGTIPTSGAEFDRHFVKGRFPAIITDGWNATGANVIASPDAETLSDLSIKRVYRYGDNKYSACEDDNVTETEATPQITFKGETWRAYFTMGEWNTYDAGDYSNMFDSEFDTTNTLSVDGGTHEMTSGFRVPQIPKLGEFTSIKILFDFGTFSGTAPSGGSPGLTYAFQLAGALDDYEITWNGGDQSIDVTADFTTTEKDAWDLERSFLFEISDFISQNDDQSVVVNEIGIEIEFAPSQTFSKEYIATEISGTVGFTGFVQTIVSDYSVRRRTVSVNTPEITDYIYFSGKGREYGAWVDADSRDNGYDSGDLIENPVYMIEDILRTELSLASANIDYVLFDEAGDSGGGDIGLVFGLAVSSIEFAFSQYKFISAWALCQDIARNCGCILYQSGDGTVKIKVRAPAYASSDRTIKYDEMQNIKPGITPLGAVRNRVTVNYDIDYATDATTAITAATNDATSQGSGADGINAIQELIYDNRFTLDSGTAVGFSTYLLDILAYRKKMLTFNILTPKHNDLEIGDTIAFSSFPSTFKIYGNTITATDIYMITQITKRPGGCSIISQEVSEVGD